MIFSHTVDLVLCQQKSQTRRIAKPTERLVITPETKRVEVPGKRLVFQVGKSYAVQPGRGKKSIARILLKDLRKETIDMISESDAKAEGFCSREEFLDTWRKIHGYHANLSNEVWVLEFEVCEFVKEALEAWYDGINTKDKSFNHCENLSSTIQKISRDSMHSGHKRSRRMGATVSY